MNVLDIIAIFIFLSGSFIFINTTYLKLPSSVGLMVLALGLSMGVLIVGKLFPDLHLANKVQEYHFEDVLYSLVINFMLFSGALRINLANLKSARTPVILLSVLGVIFSTFVIGILMYFTLPIIGIELRFFYCLAFGAIISPTDASASIKMMKTLKLDRHFQTKITAESLFNDGMSVVLALTLLDIAHAADDHVLTLFETSYIIFADVGGGMFIGLLFGYIGYKLLKYVDNDDVEVEVLITLAIVLLGIQTAEFIHVSSKQTVIVTGLVIGNEGRNLNVANVTGDYVFKFWNLLEETFSSLLFVLIGFEMLVLDLRLEYLAAGFFAVVIVLVGRWLGMLIPIKLFLKNTFYEKHTIQILTWGGLRGGLSVALSLSLAPFDGKDVILTMTYVVVVVTVLYQGFTVPYIYGSKKKSSG